MPWRDGIDDLRATARARVPGLIQRRRLPPTRGATVVWKLARAIVPWVVKHRGRRGDPEALAALAPSVRGAFEQLGATFIKLGQVIASAEGMMPAALVSEFKLCRDRVPPETFEHVRAVVEQDLGRSIEEVFAEFSPTPIAAASIAQVHTARLRSGEEVVVKVQRPQVRTVVPRDLATMAWIAPIIEKRMPQASLANMPAYVELFAETIVEELDFRLEAQNMLDIARVLATTDQRSVVVPRPHPELVSERVLVMERLHGFNIEDEAAMGDAGVDPSSVFRALMISFIEGAMIFGVFHGDLHGGNMMVTPEGKAAIFDFGITGRFTDTSRTALLGLMLTGMNQDVMAQLQYFRDLGGFAPDADLERIAADLNLDELVTMNQAEMSPEQLATQMREMVTQLVSHGAKLPKELFLYLKGMIYLNGAIAALAADVDLFAELGHVFEYFMSAHSDRFAAEIGFDVDANPFDVDSMQQRMRETMGVTSDSLTYRELQQLQNDRMEEMRAARRQG
jgi:ubiquinone biosynthesis protein